MLWDVKKKIATDYITYTTVFREEKKKEQQRNEDGGRDPADFIIGPL